VNSKRIGSTETMVASSVVLAPLPPVTRLPTETRRSPMRPSTGARSSEYSLRSSSAEWTIASCAATEASATRLGLLALIEGLLGDGLVVEKLLAAREIGFGEGEVGARLREIGAHLVERDLKRPVIDDEQEVAFLHRLAVGEMNLGQVPGDARTHLDRIDGDETADIFVLIDDRALHGLRHGDGGRRRRRLLLALTASGKADKAASDQERGGSPRRLRAALAPWP
jgi:hypothetical protein